MLPPPPPLGGSVDRLSPPSEQLHQPEIMTIRLAKTNGMGLSIVAAKGMGQDRLGIYIKAVVEGGAAWQDGHLAAGDQLLAVDGHSLIGITQVFFLSTIYENINGAFKCKIFYIHEIRLRAITLQGAIDKSVILLLLGACS